MPFAGPFSLGISPDVPQGGQGYLPPPPYGASPMQIQGLESQLRGLYPGIGPFVEYGGQPFAGQPSTTNRLGFFFQGPDLYSGQSDSTINSFIANAPKPIESASKSTPESITEATAGTTAATGTTRQTGMEGPAQPAIETGGGPASLGPGVPATQGTAPATSLGDASSMPSLSETSLPTSALGAFAQNLGDIGFASTQGPIGQAIGPTAKGMASIGLGLFGPALGPVGAVLSGINLADSLVGIIGQATSPKMGGIQAAEGMVPGVNALEAAINSPTKGETNALNALDTATMTANARAPVSAMPDVDTATPDVSDEGNPTGPTGPNAPGSPAPGPTGEPGNAGVPGVGEGEPGINGEPGDAAGAGVGGGGAASVICTELRRQGFLDDATWAADEAFGRQIPLHILLGYQAWAKPIAKRMQRSPWLTRIVWFFAKPWARQMAYGDSWAGALLMTLGVPLCALLGCWLMRRRVCLISAS